MTVPTWELRGSLRGPQGPPGAAWEVLPFTMQGQIRVEEGRGSFPIKGGTFRLETVTAAATVAPTGSPIVVDVKVNGVSIYAETDDRPTIAPGENVSIEAEHIETYLTDGDLITVDVVAVGSIMPGMYLTVVVRLQQITALDAT